jgi:DsbC/DsbD-like thiol-disulfide interchange protein
VEWDLPPGFTAGEIQWPAPEVVKMASYAAQGSEGETLLMIPITAPAVSSNKPVTLAARVSWMCCGKTCKPAVEVPFSITLPFGDAVDPDPETQSLFEKFRAMLPMEDPKWDVAVKRETSQIVLMLTPPDSFAGLKGIDRIHFFTADGQVDSNQKQQVDVFPDGRILMRLAVAETSPEHAEALPRLVSFPNGNSTVRLTINPKY